MNYRNKCLTDSAKHEACVSCGNPNACWCHSNKYRHGKGRGIKAHDIFGFYGCLKCHDWFDGRSKEQPPTTFYWENIDDWLMVMWERSMIIACSKGYL